MPDDLHELRDDTLGLSCPLQHEFSEEDWQAFLTCARHGFKTGGRLHNEFYLKIEEHGDEVSEGQVERALHRRSCLVAYEHEEMPRLGLWDPEQRVFVIGTLPDGRFYNAFGVEDFERYVNGGNFVNVRWLRECRK